MEKVMVGKIEISEEYFHDRVGGFLLRSLGFMQSLAGMQRADGIQRLEEYFQEEIESVVQREATTPEDFLNKYIEVTYIKEFKNGERFKITYLD